MPLTRRLKDSQRGMYFQIFVVFNFFYLKEKLTHGREKCKYTQASCAPRIRILIKYSCRLF